MTPLRQRIINDMTVRGLAENTKRSYLTAVTGLARHYRRSPDQISAQEVQDYLIYLHQQRGLSWKSCNCVRHGVRFLYRITLGVPDPHFYVPGAKTPSTLPQILNHDELVRLFTVTTNPKHRSLLMTAYAAGLRASELGRLQLTDIDSARMCLRIEQGKGNKDRYVPLSPRLLEQLREYWRRERPQRWPFPNQLLGQPMTRAGAAHIYKRAKDKAQIRKAGGIHTLRHAYATGLLEAGVELPVIQRRLGHTSIRSTMRYLHLAVDKTSATPSPLDLLEFPRAARAGAVTLAAHPAPARRPALEVADILRQCAGTYRHTHRLSTQQLRVVNALVSCRTAALGGFKACCDHCGAVTIQYASCRNRHCPKCQTLAQTRWVERQCAELLDIGYWHVVFTLPHELNPIAQGNPALIYRLLFNAASKTLLEFGRNPRWLGGELGITMVLHTWGQNLGQHIHVHCVVTDGALSPDRERWITPVRRGFLFPTAALSKVFRGKYLDSLTAAHRCGELRIPGDDVLDDTRAFECLRTSLQSNDWVVYTKAPFAGAANVLAYLGRYTHKSAIANHRLVDFDAEQVRFRWRDYAHGNKRKVELIRIRGHLTLWGGGIHHAEIKTAVRAGVPAPDG